MSLHKQPLTAMEESGLRAHGLDIGKPSQLSDAFRLGVRWVQESSATQAAPSVAPSEPMFPHIMEKLSYHQRERNDLTLDEVVQVLGEGWKRVIGRSERELLLQVCALLAGAPATPPAQGLQAEEVPELSMSMFASKADYDAAYRQHQQERIEAARKHDAEQARPRLQAEGVPTDERLLHLWDIHVGEPTADLPLTDADKLSFARAALAAHPLQGLPAPQPSDEPVAYCNLPMWTTGKYWPDECFSEGQGEGMSPVYATPQPAAVQADMGKVLEALEMAQIGIHSLSGFGVTEKAKIALSRIDAALASLRANSGEKPCSD